MLGPPPAPFYRVQIRMEKVPVESGCNGFSRLPLMGNDISGKISRSLEPGSSLHTQQARQK